MEIELLEVKLVVYLCVDLPDHFERERRSRKSIQERFGEKENIMRGLQRKKIVFIS